MRTTLMLAFAPAFTLFTLTAAEPTAAASFDCRAADLSAAEVTICENPTLNDKDVEMATTYSLVGGLLPEGERQTLEEDQRIWLARLDACQTNADCIAAAYAQRMSDLRTIYERVRARYQPISAPAEGGVADDTATPGASEPMKEAL